MHFVAVRNQIAEKRFRFRRRSRPIGVFLQIFVRWLDQIEDFFSLKNRISPSSRSAADVLERRRTKRWSRRNPRENPCKTTEDSSNSISPLPVARNFRNDSDRWHRIRRHLDRCPTPKRCVVSSSALLSRRPDRFRSASSSFFSSRAKYRSLTRRHPGRRVG